MDISIIYENFLFVQLGGSLMRQFHISIRSFADIQEFVSLAIAQPFEVLVGNGEQFINAKSLMAMFGLNFNRPLVVQVTCDESAYCKFRQDAKRLLTLS